MKKAVVLMAVILILFVLVGSVVLHLSGVMQGGDLNQDELWREAVSGGPPETLKAIDLTGDGEDEVFVQTPGQVLILSPEHQELLRQDLFGAKSTMGDLDGDGVDEFVIAEPFGSDLVVTAWTAGGAEIWQTIVPDLGLPSRGLSLDFQRDGKREVVFGTEDGALVCLDGVAGELHWRYNFPSDSLENMLVRGTDDVSRGGRTYLAAAVYGGTVVVLDENSKAVLEIEFPEQLRRLRTHDMDGDGVSEIMLGGLNGRIQLHSGQDGALLWSDNLGSRVQEARFLELDGDPTQTELLVGGKYGGMLAFSLAGDVLWRNSVTGKVLEFETLDYNEDGQNELLVAADKVALLEAGTGTWMSSFSVAEPTTLDVGDFGKDSTYLIGAGSGVVAVQVSYTPSPWWYSPIGAGFVLAVVIAAIAIWLSRFEGAPDSPKVTYTVQDMSLEALKARKTMLREVLEDAKRMQGDGEISAEVFLARSRSLRGQLAAVDEKILAIQPDYKPESMQCPSCGAPLSIGVDRCPYCSHVIL